MGWLAIVAALIPVLLKLVEWLKNRNSLTERQQAKLNKIIGITNDIKYRSVSMGCNPQGDVTPFTAAELSEEEDD